MSIRPGYVQTVLGPIATAQVGRMLPHEHLLWDPVGDAPSPCEAASEREKWDSDISLSNYYDVRRNYAHYKRPQQLLSINDATEEVTKFKQAGGSCIVDATPAGVGRDPEGLAAIARATGVHIVMGCGFYVASMHPPEVRDATEEEITDWIIRDITAGVGTTGIRAGLIGEIGLSWPVLPNEEKVLRAATAAQRRTGAVLMVHPGRDPKAPGHAASIVAAAGGDLSRLIVAHMERTIFSLEEFADLAETGCYLEFDLFGIESSFYPWSPIDMPNDATRIDYIIGLAKLGYAGQVLMSHDIDMKVRLEKYGGEGYSHILRNVLPLMRRKGMTETEIDQVVAANPARAYAGIGGQPAGSTE